MWLVNLIKELFNRLFSKKKDIPEEEAFEEEIDENALQEMEKQLKEDEEFKINNIILDKLNYLEQYIKIFSLTFPKEYQEYLLVIQNLRRDYQNELDEYKKGLAGNITFAIDPERESERYVRVINLEKDIKNFVEDEVNYKLHKEKFSKLCCKINVFYNALIDTDVEIKTILNQLDNARSSLSKIVAEAKMQDFFSRDSRKKEEILNYIVYSEYKMFKSFLRCSVIASFNEYKQKMSEWYSLFVNEEYDRLMFKFLIGELEELQIFITENLQNEMTYQYVLESCQKLQNDLDGYAKVFNDGAYFDRLIKLENTTSELAKSINIELAFGVPDTLDFQKKDEEIISVNSIALAILRLINNERANLLFNVIEKFCVEISWREFYFLCKIFELNNDLVEKSDDTIFSSIKDKFLKLKDKYKEYTDAYIKEEKNKILNYCGSKSKKYILLINVDDNSIDKTTSVLRSLSLDFLVISNEVYLNHSYFNGFKNLEQNFGAYKTF